MAYDWHREYFTRKVLPGFLKEMSPCAGGLLGGFYAWLQSYARSDYEALTLLEQQIGEIWIKKGDQAQFKTRCQEWVFAHLRLKSQYLAAIDAGGAQGRLI